ncbi:MAG: hypothetical protein J0L67_07910 [Cytophagales bacterium]|nr:hypothetical protein [Cytophagales bacterium]
MKPTKHISLLVAFALSVLLFSCNEDETGTPVINYIRVTNPVASDSLLVAAGQGQMIAIMGDNLQNTKEVWFNDLKALVLPTFVTKTNIILRVPSQIPNEITNTLKLVFYNGESLLYDFTVDISEPVINRMKSEYVVAGGEAIFYGNYFYAPLTVTFGGGVEGEIISVTDQELHVRIPAGVQPGPVTIASNFGEAESNFWFMDNRNLIMDFDIPLSGSGDLWHPSGGPSAILASHPDFPNISGGFLRSRLDYGAWGWAEMLTGVATAPELANMKNIPEEALLNPTSYSLKFEINTHAPLTGAAFNIYIGNNVGGANRGYNGDGYTWLPNFNTEGAWETITIPWQTFYEANRFPYSETGYGISIVVQGPNAATLNYAIDNMRVVPNTND